jgi:hypothetical protein
MRRVEGQYEHQVVSVMQNVWRELACKAFMGSSDV